MPLCRLSIVGSISAANRDIGLQEQLAAAAIETFAQKAAGIERRFAAGRSSSADPRFTPRQACRLASTIPLKPCKMPRASASLSHPTKRKTGSVQSCSGPHG